MFKIIILIPIILYLVTALGYLRKKGLALLLSASFLLFLFFNYYNLNHTVLGTIDYTISLGGLLNYHYMFGLDVLTYFLSGLSLLLVVFNLLKINEKESFHSLCLITSFCIIQLLFSSQNFMSYIFINELFIFAITIATVLKGKKSKKLFALIGTSHVLIILGFSYFVSIINGFNISYEAIKLGIVDNTISSQNVSLASLCMLIGILLRIDFLPYNSIKKELMRMIGYTTGLQIYFMILVSSIFGLIKFVLPYISQDFYLYRDYIIYTGLINCIILIVQNLRELKPENKVSNFVSIFSILSLSALMSLSKTGVTSSFMSMFLILILVNYDRKIFKPFLLIIAFIIIGLPGTPGFLVYIDFIKTFIFYNTISALLFSILMIFMIVDSVKIISKLKSENQIENILELPFNHKIKTFLIIVLTLVFGCFGRIYVNGLDLVIDGFIKKMV